MGDPIDVPAAPGNTNNVNVPVRTFNDIKVAALAFGSEHGLLKDNASDWTSAGNPTQSPGYTAVTLSGFKR